MVVVMNKEVLIVINWSKDIKLFNVNINHIKDIFENIIIVNKGSSNLENKEYSVIDGNNINYFNEINEYIKISKKDITSIIFIDNPENVTVEDILKCYLDTKKSKKSIVLGSKDTDTWKERFIDKVFNTIFNTSLRSIVPNIIAMNIELFHKILLKLNKNNYLTVVTNEEVEIKEKEIKTIWHKNRVGEPKFKVFPYLRLMFPYIIKSLIPYLISLVLFMIIFILRDSTNDLEGIIVANLISEVVGVVTHIIINYNIIYHFNQISRNILFILKKIFRIILSCFLIYIFYNILGFNLLLSKVVGDFILMSLIALLFIKLLRK